MRDIYDHDTFSLDVLAQQPADPRIIEDSDCVLLDKFHHAGSKVFRQGKYVSVNRRVLSMGELRGPARRMTPASLIDGGSRQTRTGKKRL
jgi:hypothetical protein